IARKRDMEAPKATLSDSSSKGKNVPPSRSDSLQVRKPRAPLITSEAHSPLASTQLPLKGSTSKTKNEQTQVKARQPFKERRRLENDQKEYQQGALFMDEYETYQGDGNEQGEAQPGPGRRQRERQPESKASGAEVSPPGRD